MYNNSFQIKFFKCLLILALLTSSCSDIGEEPLTLRVGAEPSAKMRNENGIEHYKAGRNYDALLQFNQANMADPTSGEIHFNLGLALWKEGKKKKAIRNFKQARKLAKGNPSILKSPFLEKVLKGN